jgi:hypothetical protein
MVEINFEKRKPSRAVIMRTIGEYLKQGATDFDITWGENWIQLGYSSQNEQWNGRGWIKEISGDDIANELNAIRKKAVNQLLNLWNT